MLKSFCAAANLRQFMNRDDCPDVMRRCQSIFETCYAGDNRGTLMSGMRVLGSTDTESEKQEPWLYDTSRLETLEDAIQQAVMRYLMQRRSTSTSPVFKAVTHAHRNIRGLQYAELHAGGKNRGGRNGHVYIQDDKRSTGVPAVIIKILSIPDINDAGVTTELLLLAVQKFKALRGGPNTFQPFGQVDIGIELWDSKLDSVEIIMPSQLISHATCRPWKTGGIVFHSNSRVSQLVVNDG